MTTLGISLLSVVRAFSSPINEEQAWSLCYQTIKNLVCSQEASSSLQSLPSQCKLNCRHRLPYIHSLEDLVLKKDGSVEIQVPSTSLSGTVLREERIHFPRQLITANFIPLPVYHFLSTTAFL